MIRAFVAIPVPDEVVRTLTTAQAGLPAGQPVPPENFHLTLAFLGEHPEPVVEDVHLALEDIRAPGFELTVSGTGMFGSDQPRALYAGIRPEPALDQLRKKVLQAARSTGLHLARQRYCPHVTLAAFSRGMPVEDVVEVRDFAARRMGLAAGPFPVTEFVLYRSMLRRSTPLYEELAAYPLIQP